MDKNVELKELVSLFVERLKQSELGEEGGSGVAEYLASYGDHNEWLVGLEELCDVLVEYGLRVSGAEVERIQVLAEGFSDRSVVTNLQQWIKPASAIE